MVMADELSIRNALIELRNFLEEEPERKDRIEALSRELGELIADRRQKADSLIAMWIRLFGFEHDEAKAFVDGVEPAKAPVDPPKKERRSSKKKRKKRKKRNSVKKSTVAIPARAKGYPNEIDETIPLAELESRFVDLLKQRWPLFTTTHMMVKVGVIKSRDQATCKVNRIRKKGVPIESARQARESGASVSSKITGYRLIAPPGN
jgi:hypothetical protein